MSQPTVNKEHQSAGPKVQHDEPLKGTLISVFFVGGFIVLTWVGVFLLFLAR
ncbi:cytochrome c oxidase subunit 2A [Bacillus marinisedimentorum]|uniref:cytochrome c oxidase subunit 2A n=1 Tax=Bacillus marinisedimentorum TaxID=1821260 RepID=UPI000ACA7326|nr:cytochrome c oxidase subunit 2A [Bacillus marinisedimentorum]